MPALPISKELFPWVPAIDEGVEGGVYPDFPSKLFARGEYAKVPILAGTSLDEGEPLPHMLTEDIQMLISIPVLKARYSLGEESLGGNI